MQKFVLTSILLASSCAIAAPVTYNIDPSHTFPSFEADHMGGLSLWRGKFNKSSGKFMLDREAKKGWIDVVIDTTSVDFGHDKMNEHALNEDMFNVKQFPTAQFKANTINFNGDVPVSAEGELTMLGVTKPLTLTINSFMCKMSPILKREVCGADASAQFNRKDFGMSYGEAYGFKMDVKLQIQVEGIKAAE